jgi:hypothetical protein
MSPEHYRTFHRDKSKGITFLASDDFATTGANYLAPKSADHQLFIQKITVNVSTSNAATLTFRDDAGTPVVIAILAGSAALGSHTVLDGGAEGIPLTLGKNLDIVASAAGVAGSLMVEAYEVLVGPVAAASTN